MMDAIKQKLTALHPEIDQILRISGSPGLSLGIVHQGAIIHTAHFGRRNADDPTPSNDNTIHSIASLTKVITAAAISQLVQAGKLHWDVPIRDYLPTFSIRQDELGMKATLRDLLSLRTGIAPANMLWGFQNNEGLLRKDENTFTATCISAAKPFGQFVYSQWNYSLVNDVVQEVIGLSIGEYIEQNVFRPLNMSRSSFSQLDDSEINIAHTHCTHDDGTASRKPDAVSNIVESGVGAAGGARSSVKDYLIFLQALLHAHARQHADCLDSTPGSIFPLTRTTFAPHVGLGPIQNPAMDEVAYCMGIYRSRLPGILSLASPNFYYTLGKKRLLPYGMNFAGTEIFHHSGLSLGHQSALFMVPATQTAVVAFTNSQPLLDPADFAAQLALSALLGEAPSVDFVEMARLARSITLKNYKLLEMVVEEGKTDVPPTKSLAAYEGDYFNAIHNVLLSVTASGSGLSVRLQRRNTGFELLPYDGDTFYWKVNREEEMCAKGMWGFMYKDWHLFRFNINANGDVEQLLWRHDPYVSSPEAFTKVLSSHRLARL